MMDYSTYLKITGRNTRMPPIMPHDRIKQTGDAFSAEPPAPPTPPAQYVPPTRNSPEYLESIMKQRQAAMQNLANTPKTKDQMMEDESYNYRRSQKYGEPYTDKTFNVTLPKGTIIYDPESKMEFGFGVADIGPQYMSQYIRALSNATKPGATFKDKTTGMDLVFGAPIKDPVSGLQFKAGYAYPPSREFDEAYKRAIQNYAYTMLSGGMLPAQPLMTTQPQPMAAAMPAPIPQPSRQDQMNMLMRNVGAPQRF